MAENLLPHKEKHQFHIQEFDGPLDLLLYLIQENKINIYNIDISLITEQFLEYISVHEAELGELSEFYKMAAELLYIKSRMLLPVTTELDETYEDPREELVERLIEYQMYKKYTDLLMNGGTGDRLYVSRNENFFAVPYDDSELFNGVTLEMLRETYVQLRLKSNSEGKMFNIHEVVSVEEKEVLLFELLDVKERVDLMELFGHADNPDDLVMHIITAFFAILKMSMEKTILIEQEGEFGTIWLRKRPDDWDDVLTERHAHDFEDGSGLKPAKGKASSYSVLTQEALDAIRKAEEKEEEASRTEEYVGEEEEIDLGDDADEEDSEETRYAKRKALCEQRTLDIKNGTFASAGALPDEAPEEAPQFLKDYVAYYRNRHPDVDFEKSEGNADCESVYARSYCHYEQSDKPEFKRFFLSFFLFVLIEYAVVYHLAAQ